MSQTVSILVGDDDLSQYVTILAQNVVKAGTSLQAALATSFLSILVCELGDKTFFLAMIMATRYLNTVVFIGSYGALFLMTILSTAFGKIATAWISPLFTNILVTVLFFYFGVRMILEAKKHHDGEENQELKEVEQQLGQMENGYIKRHSGNEPLIAENATIVKQSAPIIPNTYILGKAFMMTFLAEWGDRSQIATIALAASFNPYIVTLGAVLGHLLCTAAAIKLGSWISGKISEKKILTVGGVVFIISGLCTAALAIEDLQRN